MRKMKRIVFQGDSITDCGRSRDNEKNFGHGYAAMVKARLGLDYPNEYKFFNRGIGGERIHHVLSRFKDDMAKLQPDYLSILVGINDIWNIVDDIEFAEYDRYGDLYRMLLENIKVYIPQTKLFLMEPFCLEGYATAATEENPERYIRFKEQCAVKSAIVKGLAQEFGAVFIPLQEKLDKAKALIGDSELSYDGIHPTAIGHEIIARQWVRAFENNK